MPQYKPGVAVGSGSNLALGMEYGGYTTTLSGYASSPAVTAGNISGYEDVYTSHYKDSALYIPRQHGDSVTVWIEAAMLRGMELLGTIQTSYYYNLAGQDRASTEPSDPSTALEHGRWRWEQPCETGKPKGYGFYEFSVEKTALSARRNLPGHEINGHQL
uniref:RRM domain-containing protein n=1 Tax=Physcomitrium patens TaxID=3218 RepID=A0A2K1IDZ9_PHYPA|nr:hypothetical protein PHYPA_029658 [Physcomitrium patens]